MVSPPVELTGQWQGASCELDTVPPATAALSMDSNGTNIWYIDGRSQTGDGVETVVGWHCLDVGMGYWWGSINNSDTLWCNLWQVTAPINNNETIYINFSYGNQGVEVRPTGVCPDPSNLTLTPSSKPLQATFRLQASMPFNMTCNVPATMSNATQPYCNSFLNVTPLTATNQPLLPVMNQETCRALNTTTLTSSATPNGVAAWGGWWLMMMVTIGWFL